MMLNTAIDEAYLIVEEMMLYGIKSHKIEVTRENNELIRQVRKIAPGFSGFRCSFVGVVGGKRWFVIRDHSFDITVPSKTGELIVVDFKARRVVSRKAA
jgi:hypothetical protein